MKHLHLEPIGGVSGDMLLSTMVELGFNPEILSDILSDLLKEKVKVEFEDVNFNLLKGKRLIEKDFFKKKLIEKKEDLNSLFKKLKLKKEIIQELKKIYEKLFEGEEEAHQEKDVHLHEIGSLDTTLDLLGFLLAKDFLKISSFSIGPIPLGSGFVETEHGKLSVPVPLVEKFLKNFLVIPQKGFGETVTPTGALLISHFFKPSNNVKEIYLEKVGSGFGQKSFKDFPNVLKGYLGYLENKNESIIEIKVNLDDISGQITGNLMELLFENGAKDVLFYPVVMKKSRPGIVLEVLCEEKDFEKIKELIFKESTTLGIRYKKMEREALEREIIDVKTQYGKVPLKLGKLNGKVLQASFEFEELKKISRGEKIPLKELILKLNYILLEYIQEK